MKKSNKWDKIYGKNEVFWIFYKMEPSRIHDFNSFGSYINSKLVCPKWMEPNFRYFSCYLWNIITSKLLKLESSETTQIKEFSKLFKTIMDFNDLSFSVIEQSLIKRLGLFFFCHCHTLKPHTDFKTIRCMQKLQIFLDLFLKGFKRLLEAEICRFRILQNAWNTLYLSGSLLRMEFAMILI